MPHKGRSDDAALVREVLEKFLSASAWVDAPVPASERRRDARQNGDLIARVKRRRAAVRRWLGEETA